MTSLVFALVTNLSTQAAPPRGADAGELLHRLRHLQVVGSVLYVAAHPDDENTRLLTYLSRGMGLRAGYLSMTRGDGGQNRIGTEQSELLGVIRTHELLEARRIDGAQQFFTRARDFGYSKTPKETLGIWGHKAILADVVSAFRQFRPDVIITRFDDKGPNHGHHTASAMLAKEAFKDAANPKRFPEQLKSLQVWQANRLLRNVSHWRLPKDADVSAFLKLQIGGFDPLLGVSYGELGGAARSMHKSQGFGAERDRAHIRELFEYKAGTRTKLGVFEGLDLTWGRFEGGGVVSGHLTAAEKAFDPTAPWKAVPALLEARKAMATIKDEHWRGIKMRQLDALVLDCLGIFVEATGHAAAVTPGGAVKVQAVALNRAPAEVTLRAVHFPDRAATTVGSALKTGEPVTREATVLVPKTADTSPFWLREPGEKGRYTISDMMMRNSPKARPPVVIGFEFQVGDQTLTAETPVVWKRVDPVEGEEYRTFEVLPAVTISPLADAVVLPGGKSQKLEVVVRAHAPAKGVLRPRPPAGWTVTPESVPFDLKQVGAEQRVRFLVTGPTGGGSRTTLNFEAEVEGANFSSAETLIEYRHIGRHTVLSPAAIPLVPLQITAKGKIGYIPGAGDTVAEGLEQAGFEVEILDDERLATAKLADFDAIVIGVRAYNVNPDLFLVRERLMQYVFDGGRLITQYQTNTRWSPLPGEVGPYPIQISRDRVTDETAAVKALAKNHPVLTTPNKLGPSDWEGWVQERGLYFADDWDSRYEPVLGMRDPGEKELRGSLLVGRYGTGVFMYTGLSFFRQLPAGVPGAYRLLANMVSYEP